MLKNLLEHAKIKQWRPLEAKRRPNRNLETNAESSSQQNQGSKKCFLYFILMNIHT